MSRTGNVVRSIAWGWISKIVNILGPFLVRTIMIYKMGVLYLGLNSLFSSILGMLSLAELGFSTAIAFSMYEPIAKNNVKKINQLLNFYKNCYRLIGMVVLVIGLAVIPFLDKLIKGDYPADINIYVLYILYLVNTVSSYFLFAYKKSLLAVNQRNDVVSRITTLTLLGQYVVQSFVLCCLKDYYCYAVVMPICTIINNVLTSVCSKKLFPQYRCEGKLDISEKTNIFQKVKGLIYQKIGNVVLSSVDSVVISAILGLNVLAVYTNYAYIMTALFSFMTIIMEAIIPGVGNAIVTESTEKNYKDFKKFNFIYMWISGWMAVCLLCLYQPFIYIWVGKALMLPLRMAVLLAVSFFLYKWMDMIYVYFQAAGIWWETRFIPITAAVVNLTCNVVLTNLVGLEGIVISTMISLVLVYDICYMSAFCKYLIKDKKLFWNMSGKQILYMIVFFLGAGVTYFVCSFVDGNNWLTILIRLFVCVFVPNIIWLCIYWQFDECKETVKWIKSKVKVG